MGKSRKIVEICFICSVFAIALALVIRLALVATGLRPLNSASLGTREAFTPYTGTFLPKYQNLFGRFKNLVGNEATRQFPGYISLLEADSAVNRALNRGLFQLTFGDGYSYLPAKAQDNESLLVHRDTSHMLRILSFPNPLQQAERSVDLLSAAAERNPGASFYLYLIPTPQDLGLLYGEDPFMQSYANYVEHSLGRLGPGLTGAALGYKSLDEYLEYFFRSDHHWNYAGAYRGYLDIVDMLRAGYPDIGEPLPAGERRVLDPEFRGSLARRSATAPVTDEIFDFSIELPPHSVRLTDIDASIRELDTEYPARQEILSGGTYRYQNTYAELYHNDFPMYEYDFGSATGRRLLLLGDSSTNCMENLLASHFDRTYCVDLRYYKSFRLDGFIEENGVTDVVFLYTSPALFTICDTFRNMLEG